MKLNYLTERLSIIGRFLATGLLCISATAFIWHFPFFSNTAAMANPATNLIATADAGDKIQDKVSKDAGRAKNFIQETKENVERTASKNAARVEDATDNDGSFVERRAKTDAARIHQRAEEDAARTQKAVDNTKNAVERTVDNIKDAFGN